MEHNNSRENAPGNVDELADRRDDIHIDDHVVLIALRVLGADDEADTNGAADPNKKEASLYNHWRVVDTHVMAEKLRDFGKGKDGQKAERCYENTLK